MLESGGGSGVRVPQGDPGALLGAAGKLSGIADQFSGVAAADGIAGDLTSNSWIGLASVRFSDNCLTISQGGRKGADACRDAASVLKRLAFQLRDAIERAESSAEDYRAAEAAYRYAAVRLNFISGDDPEDDDARTLLQDQVTSATTDMDDALSRNEDANEDAETAAEQAAARLADIAGRAEPIPLSAQPGAGGVVLSSSGEKDSAALRVLVFKIGGSESALVEQRADGKWTVTIADGLEAGIEADLKPGVGSTGSEQTGRLGAGPDLQAALLAQLEKGRTYAFGSEADAARFIEAERRGEPPPADAPLVYTGPGEYANPNVLSSAAMYRTRWIDDWDWLQQQEPIESYEQGGIKGTLSGSTGIGPGGASASVSGAAILGRKVDHVKDTVTEYSKGAFTAGGQVEGPGAEASGKVSLEGVTSVTRDEDSGNLKTFSVSVTGSGEGSVKLGGGNLPGSPYVAGEGGAVRYERQVTLDAADPQNREAIERYLSTGGTDSAAVAELNQRLADDGHVDVRVYGSETETRGFEADAKLAGIEYEHQESRTELLEAREKLPGSHSQVKVELP